MSWFVLYPKTYIPKPKKLRKSHEDSSDELDYFPDLREFDEEDEEIIEDGEISY